jgi:arylsulfatase A-like enzyme
MLAAAMALLTALLTSAPVTAVTADMRPNIVLITTDDMRESDLRWMPITRSLLLERGVRVSDFLSNHPLCCPARAEILTGQFGHNNGVQSNTHPEVGGFTALRTPAEHIGTWLQRSGYRTAFVGKYLNGWERTATRQPGWTIFNPIVRGTYSPFGMTMFRNGSPLTYRTVHTADLMGRLGTRYALRFADEGKPFFIWVSQVPPHGMFVNGAWRPPVPADRHRGLFPSSVSPSTRDASFNEVDVSDKPAYVQQARGLAEDSANRSHRARIRSLQAVDEQVGNLVRSLRQAGELSSTYLIFTSDNGVLLGEHRLKGKNVPYEPSLNVPLLVRGPGLPAGVARSQTFGMVDIAPTLLAIAGAQSTRVLDGRSMLGALRHGGAGYGEYLIQAGTGELLWWWRGVRSATHTYVRYHDGTQELYDRRADPSQLSNMAGDPGSTRMLRDYAARLDQLADCAGVSCHQG